MILNSELKFMDPTLQKNEFGTDQIYIKKKGSSLYFSSHSLMIKIGLFSYILRKQIFKKKTLILGGFRIRLFF